ncbi:conserved hypothetical protein [Candidatus Glomeribacter gigasporarum BEG34]|uniref:Uncharacterized protein n=1 Tax=Candidatus Glomeribacter gigasporarum BEG34 TaxID=1070319 RepID=G2J7T5_9BURK|nr:hypothetical protein [Candidatus Glomeribacter gigasporarum]CCD28830.1 conserved hypothetical protein [Candidatus Glomeribacter gigasporarum BEG34]
MIPETSPSRYLSGIAALNIPSTRGTGDWHLIETFFRPRQQHSRLFVSGIGCETDTTPLLSNRGIFECSARLSEWQIPHPPGAVYAADHARAIADMVLVCVLDGSEPDHVELDDWMPMSEDKQAVFDLLEIAMPHLTLEQKSKVAAWKQKNAI